MHDVAARSPLTTAFTKVFSSEYESMSNRIRRGIGAGEHLALELYLDTQHQQLEGFDTRKRG